MIRPQYHFRRVGDQIHVWDVRKLVETVQGTAVHQVPLSELAEADEAYWYDLGDAEPTCRSVLEHARLINGADVTFPILLCPAGRVIDGMHRVMKAIDLGHDTIRAYRLTHLPQPDAIDPKPDDLTY